MKYNILVAGFVTGIALVVLPGLFRAGNPILSGRVITPQETRGSWLSLDALAVQSGATIPMHTNVFFEIPADVVTIFRETLLGYRGNKIRYWGYCFEDADDPLNPPQSIGFPGKIFLSEAERDSRRARDERLRIVSPLRAPVNPRVELAENSIRHMIDVFPGGVRCFIMSDQPLPIGVDTDNDDLNTQLEKNNLTDPANPDTDDDGLDDGKEVLYWGTDPRRRDTDGDGIIDGREDKSHNGFLDAGETDPRQRDSDGDGLCDGYCRENKVRRICQDNKGTNCLDVPYGQWAGEDKNYNGIIDTGESDPTMQFTLKDGLRDDQRFYRCLLERKTDLKKDC